MAQSTNSTDQFHPGQWVRFDGNVWQVYERYDDQLYEIRRDGCAATAVAESEIRPLTDELAGLIAVARDLDLPAEAIVQTLKEALS